jgi:hypothetical protein
MLIYNKKRYQLSGGPVLLPNFDGLIIVRNKFVCTMVGKKIGQTAAAGRILRKYWPLHYERKSF